MQESNIFFATNTYRYGYEYTGPTKNKFNESKGDTAFFRKVMDYDALKKLKKHPKMHGSLNSNYYVAHISQVRVLDPNFYSVMVQTRNVDPLIEEENKKNDAEYGYPINNNYYPLIEEIVIDDEEFTYADEILGKWVQSDQGLESTNDNPFGLYIKQKTEKDTSSETVSPKDAGFEDIEDTDPYYYIYEEAAGKEKKSIGNLDKAKLYEEKYGSIFRAFSDVTQEEIIQAPIDQFSFVNAGPGTGKTYTLMKKIMYMIDTLEADPEGILVLCFTNAAVNEIKARIKQHAEAEGDRTFINIDVRTFHSFSWLLISQANELFIDRPNYRYIDISRLNYDQSIREATRIIRKFGDEVFGGVEHLFVDEIQDLTNERASLVMAMVQECMKNGVGITVLGDSCQAIYDYSDDDTTFVLKSDRFYKYLFSEFYERGVFYNLDKNHRQNTGLINITTPLRKAILGGKKQTVLQTIALMNNAVHELITGNASVKITQYQLNKLLEKGTVCFMCRNNAQVLATSTNFRKRGIKHIVNAYNEFEYLSDWIGKVFGPFTKSIITLGEFDDLLRNVTDNVQPVNVWERLQDVIGSQNNVLKVSEILSTIAKSKVDDPIFRNVPRGKLIVSNIHKSKGREYDTVVLERKFVNRLINDSTSIKSVQEYLEEAKTLYVAVTRPRNTLYFNNLATSNVSLKKIKTGRKRWVRGDGSNLARIEIRALSDADISSFNTLDVQNYVINYISDGDEINLVLNNIARDLSYDIVHLGTLGEKKIGKTSTELIDDIEAIISPYESPWPKRITDLYVSGIYSQIASDYQSVWCWVDFCGLGTALNDVY